MSRCARTRMKKTELLRFDACAMGQPFRSNALSQSCISSSPLVAMWYVRPCNKQTVRVELVITYAYGPAEYHALQPSHPEYTKA